MGKQENFAFLHNSVLFLGINLITTSYSVEQENLDWIVTNMFPQGLDDLKSMRAIVIFGHVNPLQGKKKYRAFFQMLQTVLEDSVPHSKILYIHGGEGRENGQGYVEYHPFANDDITAIEVCQVGGSISLPPLKVTIANLDDDEEEWYFIGEE